MYYLDQIVFDLRTRAPVRVKKLYDYERRTTHFIRYRGERRIVEIALPKTIAEARVLLRLGHITPAPIPESHCWCCLNWHTNCKCTNDDFDNEYARRRA